MSKLPYVNETHKQEHDDASPRTKRVSLYGWDTDNAQKTRLTVTSDGELKVVNPDGSDVMSGVATSANQTAILAELEKMSGLSIPEYDSGTVSYPDSTTEVYVFKSGGLSGTTVATVTLTYTDSTKDLLSSWEKS